MKWNAPGNSLCENQSLNQIQQFEGAEGQCPPPLPAAEYSLGQKCGVWGPGGFLRIIKT